MEIQPLLLLPFSLYKLRYPFQLVCFCMWWLRLQLLAVAQCMGDTVVQRSAQLHWGLNLSFATKAESSNCAGSCFWRLCPRCVDALLCGAQSAVLHKTLRKLIAVGMMMIIIMMMIMMMIIIMIMIIMMMITMMTMML